MKKCERGQTNPFNSFRVAFARACRQPIEKNYLNAIRCYPHHEEASKHIDYTNLIDCSISLARIYYDNNNWSEMRKALTTAGKLMKPYYKMSCPYDNKKNILLKDKFDLKQNAQSMEEYEPYSGDCFQHKRQHIMAVAYTKLSAIYGGIDEVRVKRAISAFQRGLDLLTTLPQYMKRNLPQNSEIEIYHSMDCLRNIKVDLTPEQKKKINSLFDKVMDFIKQQDLSFVQFASENNYVEELKQKPILTVLEVESGSSKMSAFYQEIDEIDAFEDHWFNEKSDGVSRKSYETKIGDLLRDLQASKYKSTYNHFLQNEGIITLAVLCEYRPVLPKEVDIALKGIRQAGKLLLSILPKTHSHNEPQEKSAVLFIKLCERLQLKDVFHPSLAEMTSYRDYFYQAIMFAYLNLSQAYLKEKRYRDVLQMLQLSSQYYQVSDKRTKEAHVYAEQFTQIFKTIVQTYKAECRTGIIDDYQWSRSNIQSTFNIIGVTALPLLKKNDETIRTFHQLLLDESWCHPSWEPEFNKLKKLIDTTRQEKRRFISHYEVNSMSYQAGQIAYNSTSLLPRTHHIELLHAFVLVALNHLHHKQFSEMGKSLKNALPLIYFYADPFETETRDVKTYRTRCQQLTKVQSVGDAKSLGNKLLIQIVLQLSVMYCGVGKPLLGLQQFNNALTLYQSIKDNSPHDVDDLLRIINASCVIGQIEMSDTLVKATELMELYHKEELVHTGDKADIKSEMARATSSCERQYQLIEAYFKLSNLYTTSSFLDAGLAIAAFDKGFRLLLEPTLSKTKYPRLLMKNLCCSVDCLRAIKTTDEQRKNIQEFFNQTVKFIQEAPESSSLFFSETTDFSVQSQGFHLSKIKCHSEQVSRLFARAEDIQSDACWYGKNQDLSNKKFQIRQAHVCMIEKQLDDLTKSVFKSKFNQLLQAVCRITLASLCEYEIAEDNLQLVWAELEKGWQRLLAIEYPSSAQVVQPLYQQLFRGNVSELDRQTVIIYQENFYQAMMLSIMNLSQAYFTSYQYQDALLILEWANRYYLLCDDKKEGVKQCGQEFAHCFNQIIEIRLKQVKSKTDDDYNWSWMPFEIFMNLSKTALPLLQEKQKECFYHFALFAYINLAEIKVKSEDYGDVLILLLQAERYYLLCDKKNSNISEYELRIKHLFENFKINKMTNLNNQAKLIEVYITFARIYFDTNQWGEVATALKTAAELMKPFSGEGMLTIYHPHKISERCQAIDDQECSPYHRQALIAEAYIKLSAVYCHSKVSQFGDSIAAIRTGFKWLMKLPQSVRRTRYESRHYLLFDSLNKLMALRHQFGPKQKKEVEDLFEKALEVIKTYDYDYVLFSSGNKAFEAFKENEKIDCAMLKIDGMYRLMGFTEKAIESRNNEFKPQYVDLSREGFEKKIQEFSNDLIASTYKSPLNQLLQQECNNALAILGEYHMTENNKDTYYQSIMISYLKLSSAYFKAERFASAMLMLHDSYRYYELCNEQTDNTKQYLQQFASLVTTIASTFNKQLNNKTYADHGWGDCLFRFCKLRDKVLPQLKKDSQGIQLIHQTVSQLRFHVVIDRTRKKRNGILFKSSTNHYSSDVLCSLANDGINYLQRPQLHQLGNVIVLISRSLFHHGQLSEMAEFLEKIKPLVQACAEIDTDKKLDVTKYQQLCHQLIQKKITSKTDGRSIAGELLKQIMVAMNVDVQALMLNYLNSSQTNFNANRAQSATQTLHYSYYYYELCSNQIDDTSNYLQPFKPLATSIAAMILEQLNNKTYANYDWKEDYSNDLCQLRDKVLPLLTNDAQSTQLIHKTISHLRFHNIIDQLRLKEYGFFDESLVSRISNILNDLANDGVLYLAPSQIQRLKEVIVLTALNLLHHGHSSEMAELLGNIKPLVHACIGLGNDKKMDLTDYQSLCNQLIKKKMTSKKDVRSVARELLKQITLILDVDLFAKAFKAAKARPCIATFENAISCHLNPSQVQWDVNTVKLLDCYVSLSKCCADQEWTEQAGTALMQAAELMEFIQPAVSDHKAITLEAITHLKKGAKEEVTASYYFYITNSYFALCHLYAHQNIKQSKRAIAALEMACQLVNANSAAVSGSYVRNNHDSCIKSLVNAAFKFTDKAELKRLQGYIKTAIKQESKQDPSKQSMWGVSETPRLIFLKEQLTTLQSRISRSEDHYSNSLRHSFSDIIREKSQWMGNKQWRDSEYDFILKNLREIQTAKAPHKRPHLTLQECHILLAVLSEQRWPVLTEEVAPMLEGFIKGAQQLQWIEIANTDKKLKALIEQLQSIQISKPITKKQLHRYREQFYQAIMLAYLCLAEQYIAQHQDDIQAIRMLGVADHYFQLCRQNTATANAYQKRFLTVFRHIFKIGLHKIEKKGAFRYRHVNLQFVDLCLTVLPLLKHDQAALRDFNRLIDAKKYNHIKVDPQLQSIIDGRQKNHSSSAKQLAYVRKESEENAFLAICLPMTNRAYLVEGFSLVMERDFSQSKNNRLANMQTFLLNALPLIKLYAGLRTSATNDVHIFQKRCRQLTRVQASEANRRIVPMLRIQFKLQTSVMYYESKMPQHALQALSEAVQTYRSIDAARAMEPNDYNRFIQSALLIGQCQLTTNQEKNWLKKCLTEVLTMIQQQPELVRKHQQALSNFISQASNKQTAISSTQSSWLEFWGLEKKNDDRKIELQEYNSGPETKLLSDKNSSQTSHLSSYSSVK